MLTIQRIGKLILCTILLLSETVRASVYMEPNAFIEAALGEQVQTKILWIKPELRQLLKEELGQNVLGQSVKGARIRYWQNDLRSVWILEKVGRDEPITIGFVIEGQQIQNMAILEFRESRGFEVRYPQFTNQFRELSLLDDKELSAHVDNITGATLSVNAVKKTARLALFLQSYVDKNLKAQGP